MKKLLKRSLVMTLVTVLLIGTFAISADAVMKRTVKKQTFTTTTSTIVKKAVAVKKGTTNFTVSKGQGYMKFTAPKTKTYTFTFSNIKDSRSYTHTSFIEIQTKDKEYPSSSFMTKAATKGGKNNTLWLGVNGAYTRNSKKTVDKAYASRYAKIKLNKGQQIYFYFYNMDNKTTGKLVIK